MQSAQWPFKSLRIIQCPPTSNHQKEAISNPISSAFLQPTKSVLKVHALVATLGRSPVAGNLMGEWEGSGSGLHSDLRWQLTFLSYLTISHEVSGSFCTSALWHGCMAAQSNSHQQPSLPKRNQDLTMLRAPPSWHRCHQGKPETGNAWGQNGLGEPHLKGIISIIPFSRIFTILKSIRNSGQVSGNFYLIWGSVLSLL